MSFWLEYDQNGSKQEYPFDSSSVSVGREKNADFVLDHPTVSRQHALIVKNNGGFKLVVLSRSGLTALDGNQVQGEVDLYDGSVLHFGQLSFTFRSNEAPQAPSRNGGQPAAALGTTPAPGFGGQQFGSTPAGQQPSSGGSPGGFGGQQGAPGGFGTQETSSSPGGHGAGGGFGAQPGGFGGQPNPQGGGETGGFGGGSFGSGSLGQGEMGAQDSSPRAPQTSPPNAPETNNGIMSWDAIAASAQEDNQEPGGGPTDFERIQAAAEKADKQSGSNPVLLVGAGILIVGMLVFILMPQDSGRKGGGGSAAPFEETPAITFQPGVLDCVGKAECMAKARQSYKVGMETLDKVEVDIRNRFEGYRRLVMAEEFASKAGHETLPAEFAELESRRDKAREELDGQFRLLRVKYHDLGNRKMYNEMVAVLNEVMAVFPYKSAREHQWALGKERQLKEQGNYPQTFQ